MTWGSCEKKPKMPEFHAHRNLADAIFNENASNFVRRCASTSSFEWFLVSKLENEIFAFKNWKNNLITALMSMEKLKILNFKIKFLMKCWHLRKPSPINASVSLCSFEWFWSQDFKIKSSLWKKRFCVIFDQLPISTCGLACAPRRGSRNSKTTRARRFKLCRRLRMMHAHVSSRACWHSAQKIKPAGASKHAAARRVAGAAAARNLARRHPLFLLASARVCLWGN